MPPTIDDSQILEMFSHETTKEKAFELLVKKYKQDIYYNVRKMVLQHEDANDVSQNVLIKIWRHLGKFRGEASLRTWISRICSNESLTFLDKKKRSLQIYEGDYTDYREATQPQSAGENDFYSATKIYDILQQAMLTLPDKQRTVFSLRYYDEMPYEEMSKVLNTSVGALKASYHFAAKKVETFLKDY
ncbi:MAG: sigma-70 family RNA polymerase sigma factor [Bacteroidales bacterium]|jgi:RNA polymerase sigma-70 factor (ECF subfamily)|nr:sigma-70 family RNA polymerase sigma factor [Bacteroidales bacterium]